MVYSINKIHIKNFKLFEDIPQPIVLGDTSLTVFDGPNGFGKTSIFDVIELILTGKLKRIKKSDARTKYKDLLFQNDSSTDSVLKIEFKNKDDSSNFTLCKVIPANLLTVKNSPDDFNIFNTHLLESFEDVPSTENLVKDSVESLITEKFGVDISNVFNLVYYIEQEDSKFFLRMNESDRLNQIAMLFNTDKQEAEVKRYQDIRNLVNKKRNLLSAQITPLEKLMKEIENKLGESEDNIEYFRLLPHLLHSTEWDKEELKSITFEIREKYILDLNQLDKFIRNFETFEKQKYNEKINNYLENNELIKDLIILKTKSSDLNEVINQYEHQVEIYKEIKKMSEEAFLAEWKNIDFNKVFKFFTLNSPDIFSENEKSKIDDKIKELLRNELNASSLSESVRELINIRTNFVNKFNEIHAQDNHDDKPVECPLCGELWSSYSEFITNLENKKNSFEAMLDDTSNLIKDSLENLFQSVVKKLSTNSLEYFNPENNHVISTNLYQQIITSKKNTDHVDELYNWIIENNINLDDILLVNNDFIDKREIQIYLEKVRELFKSKLKPVTINLSNPVMAMCTTLFTRYFNENPDFVKNCSQELIEKKKRYINFCYYNNIFAQKEELNVEIRKLRKEYRIYDALWSDLGNVITEYNKNIKSYWKQIMKDIEIVFYIYSAKILQTHQRGNGIFLKESKSQTIRFITHPSRDHDVSNFMSSGQLSAIILALTLSLNKVYGNKGLSSLLIDDPLQTMDDINTSSLIELLRNDFSNRQIVLSTHEENVSSFIRYKFSTYNLNSQSFNLKNEFHS